MQGASDGTKSLLDVALGVKTAYAASSDIAAPPQNKSFFQTIMETLGLRGNITYDAKAYDIAAKNPPSKNLDGMVDAIARMEGWIGGSPDSRARRNNNPGNLKYAGQHGASKDKDGFAVFDNLKDGVNALKYQLMSAATGTSSVYHPNMTLYDFFSKYAPAHDKNNPRQYAEFVANTLNVLPTTRLKDLLIQPQI